MQLLDEDTKKDTALMLGGLTSVPSLQDRARSLGYDADEHSDLRAAEGILIGALIGLAVIGAGVSVVLFLWQ